MSVYCWDRVSQQPILLPAIQRWKLLAAFRNKIGDNVFLLNETLKI